MARKTRANPTGVKELPSFVLGRSRANKYDWQRNIYNWRPDNTRRIKAGCGRAAASGKAHFATLGTSITSGYMGDTASPGWDMKHSWPVIMRNTLATQGIPVGGSGFCATANEGVLPDQRWSVLSGSWGLPAAKLGYGYAAGSGAALRFTTDLPGMTKVTVWYYTNSGAFTVNVNAAGAVTVTPSGIGVSVAKYELTGTFGVGTTVDVTTTSASPTYIIGAMVSSATGLDVHNLAVATTLASDWVSLTGGGLADSHIGALTNSGITPDGVFLEFGPNEKITAASISSFKTAMTTVKGYFASSDIVLVGCPSWPDFSNELFELADTFDCPFIDVFSRFGGLGASDPGWANGMSNDTAHVHPIKQCHASWGINTAGAVMS